MDRVLTEGIGTGLEHVRLEDAVRDADVSRTAAYRCWPQREEFLADVLAELAEHALPIASTRGARATTVVRAAVGTDAAALRTVDGRRSALLRAVRASADDDLQADLDEYRRWRLYLTLAMAVPSLPEGPQRQRVVDAVAHAEEQVIRRLDGNYRRLLDLFGFTSTIGYRELARIGLSVMRGYVIGGHAGSREASPGEAFALLVDGAAAPSDTATWSEQRCRRMLAELAADDVFEAAPGGPAGPGVVSGGE
ncbi:hypothetical protein GCM10027289_24040 [Tsukamurella serpentis]